MVTVVDGSVMLVVVVGAAVVVVVGGGGEVGTQGAGACGGNRRVAGGLLGRRGGSDLHEPEPQQAQGGYEEQHQHGEDECELDELGASLAAAALGLGRREQLELLHQPINLARNRPLNCEALVTKSDVHFGRSLGRLVGDMPLMTRGHASMAPWTFCVSTGMNCRAGT